MNMNDTIIQDSIKVAEAMISNPTETSDSTNWWMWLAIAEFGIVGFLILKERFKSKVSNKQRFKEESLKQDVDFDNIINSSFNSIKLYDELKVKCHPDRFPSD